MNTKYFKTLPEQEYVFKNFFTCGKDEGLCCSDCGTYITNIVQVIGKADKQIYNLGTTCCDKISKDRSVFLTPLSVQRKKIFMTAFKKFQKNRKELELCAQENGGAVKKFADAEIDYMNNFVVSLFIYCKNGALIYARFEAAQRCLSGLKELTEGFNFIFDFSEVFSKKWDYEALNLVKKMEHETFKKYNPDMWAEKLSNWQGYLKGEEIKSIRIV